jgi:hypothetical protein
MIHRRFFAAAPVAPRAVLSSGELAPEASAWLPRAIDRYHWRKLNADFLLLIGCVEGLVGCTMKMEPFPFGVRR